MLRAIIRLSLCLAAAYGEYPSSRIVYYLHTTPASWASARETCVREGGHLLNLKNQSSVMADIDTLDRVLEWKGAFSSLNSDVWSGLYRFTDPTSGADTLMWHRCEAFTNTASSTAIRKRRSTSPSYCFRANATLDLQPEACDTKLPYICQVDEGQCWFLPVEHKTFSINASSSSEGDINTCAKTCRNDNRENNYECWGFVENAGNCLLYRDDGRHAFIRSTEKYLKDDSNETAYVKICTGGQCWFLPVEHKTFSINASSSSEGDINTCAKTCRNDNRENNYECWGFVENAGNCLLYRDDGRHAFIRSTEKYLKDDSNETAYVKICTGGEVTSMNPVVEDNSVKPTNPNCTANEGTNGNWDSSVCYCDCDQPPVILDPEYIVLPMDEKIDRIVKDLKVNAKDTSANYRKLNSIEDGRPSAQSIGAVGIVILAVVFGSLVLFDMDVVISFVWRVCCRKDGGSDSPSK